MIQKNPTTLPASTSNVSPPYFFDIFQTTLFCLLLYTKSKTCQIAGFGAILNAMNTNLVLYISVAGFILLTALIVWLFLVEFRLKKLFRGKKADNLEEIFWSMGEDLKELQNNSEKTDAYLRQVEERLKNSLKKVIVDTTVQEKNIAYPMDAKSQNKIREHLVRFAKKAIRSRTSEWQTKDDITEICHYYRGLLPR